MLALRHLKINNTNDRQEKIMARQRKQSAPQERIMDTGLISPFEKPPRRRAPDEGPFVSAVLFASGRLVEADSSLRVFSLVASGYEGVLFGDDGTFTARVASELPLERWDGVRRLEEFVDDAVRAVNPAYAAEHVGFCGPEEAAVYITAMTKYKYSEVISADELAWEHGTLSLAHSGKQPTTTN